MNQLVKMDLMDKKITLDIVDEAYNIINFEKYKLNFHNELFNVKKVIGEESYNDLNFRYIQMNKELNKLPITFVNMIYYRKKYFEHPEIILLYRFPECSYFQELYFFYFFFLVDNVINFEDKIAIFLNRIFNLGIEENNVDTNFKQRLIKQIKGNNTLYSNEDIKKLCDYLSNFKYSIYANCKKDYRDLHTHSFTTELPKLEIKDGKKFYNADTNITNSYENCLELLKEFRQLIDLINNAMNSYFKNIVGVDN